ncbi:hypothetical protein F6U93_05780 [Tamlana haliotis]|uniref:Uncharacterized protein n=1 Tax=Pseudotamlana haliotis TaxID=2614804 RepID=A0A6N6MD81_9FLAO|nr:hypothetical protein [Tamlana haliotis]KAB1068627.1 hypothetical protein F6U93_05780 [Tamlana haliotis]
MAKTNYKMNWYDYIITSIIFTLMALAIAFKWFSSTLGGKSYSEISSSKQSAIAYSISVIEQSNWRYVLVVIFFLFAIISFKNGLKIFKEN